MKLENNIHGNINLLGDLFSAKKVFYDSSISGLPTNNVQVAIDTLDASLDAVYADAFGVETVSRTIYVETTGNDITGDGLTVGTAFATIGKALSTVKKVIIAGITVTIQIGIGTFEFDQNDNILLGTISGNNDGTLMITGSLVLVNSGFTVGSALSNDPLTYSVSGGDTSTWTTNQWKYYFIKSGTIYYPITGNSSSTLSIAGSNAGTEIYQAQTIINFSIDIDDFYHNINLDISKIKWVISSGFKITNLKFIRINTCYLTLLPASYASITLGNIGQYDCRWHISYSSFEKIYLILNNKGRFAFNNNYYYMNANAGCLTIQGDSGGGFLDYNVFENPSTSVSSCGINNTQGETQLKMSKFINCNCCIRQNSFPKSKIIGSINSGSGEILTSAIIINCNYFYGKRVTSNNDYNSSVLYVHSTLGTPNIKWFYDPMYEFVNFNTGRNIYIKGIIYPEFEQNLSSTLTNNTITPIIIGDVSQNISCKVDYTIKRGSGFRSGNFNIISDTSNSYITPDVFGTNYDSAVDASAIYFSTDISNGKYIMMNVTQNNSTDASLFYNVSRVMRTPIII